MPELAGVFLACSPERWAALGFEVRDAQISLGAVRLQLGMPGSGITAWTLDAVDGLATARLPPEAGGGAVGDGGAGAGAAAAGDRGAPAHPNGAVALDHIVVVTPRFEHTRDALAGAGMPLGRVAEMRGTRMGFRRIGPAILELVEAPEAERAAFWGLVIVVRDLDALGGRLGSVLGAVRPAVQPGRRIATVTPSAGLSTNLAFMDPEPGRKAVTS